MNQFKSSLITHNVMLTRLPITSILSYKLHIMNTKYIHLLSFCNLATVCCSICNL